MIITKRIYLEPRYLDSNIHQHLLKKLEDEKEVCNRDYGYILYINPDITIIGNENTTFTVKFEAKTFKPDIGIVLEGKVCMLFRDGIFIDIDNIQQVIIPSANTKGYKYCEVSSQYKNGDKSINVGDLIKVEIVNVRYSNGNFSCIGSLKD